ncbi:MAG: DUF4430 domain-containing protein, partial [Lachnospiraceae bacterium]|nr:DUF4430 domain-containing protein [Lachnospiraceae bacterium]
MKGKKAIKALLLFALMAAVFFGVDKKAQAAAEGTVYVAVEKFTIGQGYIVEPREITISSGERVSSVFERLMDEEGLTASIDLNSSYGWYLEGIKNVDTGDGHIPACIQGMSDNPPTDADIYPASEKNINYPDLEQFSYTTTSGWCYAVNNVFPSVGMGNYTAHDGDVIRFRFTIHGTGADLGNGWPGSLTLPNLDQITKRMAVFNANRSLCFSKGYSEAYAEVLSVVINMDSTNAQIDAAYEKLPTETQIETWVQENEILKQNQTAAQKAINSIKAISSS